MIHTGRKPQADMCLSHTWETNNAVYLRSLQTPPPAYNTLPPPAYNTLPPPAYNTLPPAYNTLLPSGRQVGGVNENCDAIEKGTSEGGRMFREKCQKKQQSERRKSPGPPVSPRSPVSPRAHVRLVRLPVPVDASDLARALRNKLCTNGGRMLCADADNECGFYEDDNEKLKCLKKLQVGGGPNSHLKRKRRNPGAGVKRRRGIKRTGVA
jgi:hypothetical protein